MSLCILILSLSLSLPGVAFTGLRGTLLGVPCLPNAEVQADPSTADLSWFHYLSKDCAHLSQAGARSHSSFCFLRLEPSTSLLYLTISGDVLQKPFSWWVGEEEG